MNIQLSEFLLKQDFSGAIKNPNLYRCGRVGRQCQSGPFKADRIR